MSVLERVTNREAAAAVMISYSFRWFLTHFNDDTMIFLNQSVVGWMTSWFLFVLLKRRRWSLIWGSILTPLWSVSPAGAVWVKAPVTSLWTSHWWRATVSAAWRRQRTVRHITSSPPSSSSPPHFFSSTSAFSLLDFWVRESNHSCAGCKLLSLLSVLFCVPEVKLSKKTTLHNTGTNGCSNAISSKPPLGRRDTSTPPPAAPGGGGVLVRRSQVCLSTFHTECAETTNSELDCSCQPAERNGRSVWITWKSPINYLYI